MPENLSYLVGLLIRVPYFAFLVIALVILAKDLTGLASKLRTKSAPMYLLISGSVLAVYLLYLTACAAAQRPDTTLFVLPFFMQMSADGLALLINIAGALTLAVWVLWGVLYSRSKVREG